MDWDTTNGSLTFVKGAGKNCNYTYLSDGQRISKDVGGDKTAYSYNAGMLLYEETKDYRLNFYYDADGLVTEIGYQTKDNGNYSDETRYFYSRNGQGDIIAIYRCKDSTLVGTYEYDLWGNPVSQNENVFTKKVNGKTVTITDEQGILDKSPFRYRGYYYDKETGFYYLNARYYDPIVHRFISAEPNHKFGNYDKSLGMSAYNLFTYCGNDPVNLLDQTGEFVISAIAICIGVGALVGMVIGGIIGDAVADYYGYTGWDKVGSIIYWACALGIIGAVVGWALAPIIMSATGIAGISIAGGSISVIPYVTSNIDSLGWSNINHIIEGSVGKDHKWYLLSPTKDWNVIKQIMTNVLRIGQESIWKIDNSGITYIKTANIQGYLVSVTYRIINSELKIGNGWVN